MKPGEESKPEQNTPEPPAKKKAGIRGSTAMYIGMFGGGFLSLFVPLGDVNPFTKAILFSIVGGIIGQFALSGKGRESSDSAARQQGPRCVSCQEAIEVGVKVCPKCGWAQPG